jgi:hypothetical protein
MVEGIISPSGPGSSSWPSGFQIADYKFENENGAGGV